MRNFSLFRSLGQFSLSVWFLKFQIHSVTALRHFHLFAYLLTLFFFVFCLFDNSIVFAMEQDRTYVQNSAGESFQPSGNNPYQILINVGVGTISGVAAAKITGVADPVKNTIVKIPPSLPIVKAAATAGAFTFAGLIGGSFIISNAIERTSGQSNNPSSPIEFGLFDLIQYLFCHP